MFNIKPISFIHLGFVAIANVWLLGSVYSADEKDPPFHGTIFPESGIITEADPSDFIDLNPSGQGMRRMYDRRSGWIHRKVWLFEANYHGGRSVEVQVNPEFETQDEAQTQARRFARVIGRLPRCLRTELKSVWIHKGNKPFGGGNNNLLIHTGQAEDYIRSGILEETLVHEACHTSLDGNHSKAEKWLAAQKMDPRFISTYARDNPLREDIAESFLPYMATQFSPTRVSHEYTGKVVDSIPARIDYFDSLKLDLAPWFSAKEKPESVTDQNGSQ